MFKGTFAFTKFIKDYYTFESEVNAHFTNIKMILALFFFEDDCVWTK